MSFLLHVAASNVVLAAGLALIALCVSRVWKNPHVAHLLWVLVLAKLITPPLWSVPIPVGAFAAAGSAEQAAGGDDSESDFASPTSVEFDGTTEYANVSLPPATDVAVAPLAPSGARVEPQQPADMAPSAAAAKLSLIDWPALRAWLAILWLASSILCIVVAAIRIWAFHRIACRGSAPGDAISERVDHLAAQLGLRRAPRVCIVDEGISPMIWPLSRRRMLLLPQRLIDELTAAQLDTVIAHELAHLVRRDELVRILEMLVTCLFWWNPLAWIARRQIHAAEEECCDALVVCSFPQSRQAYGEALLVAAEMVTFGRSLPALASAFGRRRVLKRRVEMILNQEFRKSASLPAKLALLVIAATLLPLAATAMSPSAEENAARHTDSAAGPPAGEVAADSGVVPAAGRESIDEHQEGHLIDGGESLETLVLSVNRELVQKFSVLDPRPLTMQRLRKAIQAAIDELSTSDRPQRSVLVATLETILAEGRLPENVRFYILPIKHGFDEDSPNYGATAVSLNFTLLAPTGPRQLKMVGLTDIVETYLIWPTQEDAAKPTRAGDSAQPAGNWHSESFQLPERRFVKSIAFTRDSRSLVSISSGSGPYDGDVHFKIRTWSLADKTLAREVELQWEQQWNRRATNLQLADGGTKAISTLTAGELGIWSADDGQLVRRLKLPDEFESHDAVGLFSLVCTADMSRIACGRSVSLGSLDRNSQIFVWDGATGEVVRVIQAPHGLQIHSIAISNDGKRLATGGFSWDASVWDIDSGERLLSFRNDNTGRRHPDTGMNASTLKMVLGVGLSGDGKTLAVGDVFGAKLIDAATGELQHRLEAPARYGIPDFIFSPDGQMVARLGMRLKLKKDGGAPAIPIWSTRTGELIASLPIDANDAAFSADGNWFAVGYSDKEAALSVWRQR